MKAASQFGRHLAVALKLSTALGLTVALPAMAGGAPGGDVDDLPEFGITAVAVTAQKRAAATQDTPISVTAVSGDEIEDSGITEFADLASGIPGISLKTSGPGQTEFEMRGMTSSGGNSPTVGFYLDDVPMSAPAEAQNGKVVIAPSLYDLNRVEVLRGPQGTLYGSGSMGGTIKLVSNQPDLSHYQASAETTLSGTDGGGINHGENAMINIPLIANQLALRIVGSEDYTSGWLDRIVVGNFPQETNNNLTRGNVLASPVLSDKKDVNDEELYGTKLMLTWKPTDQLTITPEIIYQKISQGAPNAFDSVPGTNAHYEVFPEAEPFYDQFTLYSANANYAFDSFDITSVTAKWRRQESITQDSSEVSQWYFQTGFYPPTGLGPASVLEVDQTQQWSEELRFASRGDGPLQWLVGGFYSQLRSGWQVYENIANLEQAAGSPTNDLFNLNQPTKIRQESLFGEASYAITDQIKLTAGLRWYSFRSSLDVAFGGLGSPTGSDAVFETANSERAVGRNPKINLSYEPTRDLMVYATAAKGFRPGGANEPVPTSSNTAIGQQCLASLESLGRTSAPFTYDPDSDWSYEIGEKARFLEDRISVNASAYYENWYGIQQNILLSCSYPYTDNAGNARIYGGELEVRATLGEGLTLAAGGGYTNAEMKDSVQETGSVKGDTLPDVPPWNGRVNLSYARQLNDVYGFSARLENTYVGVRQDVAFTPKLPLPAYDITNIRAGISRNDGWGAVLFINNLFNKRAWIENQTELSFEVPTFNRVTTNQPLTIGLDITYHY